VTTVLVLVILAAIWAAVLVPPYLQNRRETRPGDSIASFRSQLSVLERTTPGGRTSNLARLDVGHYAPPAYAPPAARRRPASQAHAAVRRAEARRRRRDVFLTLLGAVVVTFLLAVALGGPVWMLHLAVDALFGGYVLMLISLQQQSVEREHKVRYIRPAPQQLQRNAEPLLLRRSGS
jgi:Flp pilus assembly protein TadB